MSSLRRRSKMMTTSSWFIVVVAAAVFIGCESASSYEVGKVTDSVISLTPGTYRDAINDPANPLWFLKFYAPWCGHCKRMAPTLEKVAPFVSGKMSIGKIDCTTERSLCDEYRIRGYPTLKFAMDGAVYDYSGGRSADDIIDFAEKMNRPAVVSIDSVTEAMSLISGEDDVVSGGDKRRDPGNNNNGGGVAFVAYHRDVEGETVDDMLQSTRYTQVFAQVARKNKAYGTFLLIKPTATPTSTTTTVTEGDGEEANEDEQQAEAGGEEEEVAVVRNDPYELFSSMERGERELRNGIPFYICRIEDLVDPRCYEAGPNDDDDGTAINTEDLNSFVRENNVPTVIPLTSSNFNKVGRMGRPLVIAIIDQNDREQIAAAREKFVEYVTRTAPESARDRYYYGYFDGRQWSRFLEQFEGVNVSDGPQLLLLDVPKKEYWTDASYKLNVEDFLRDVLDGTVKSAIAGKSGFDGFLHRLYNLVLRYRPYSVVLLVLVFLAFFVGILSVVSPGEDLRPPYEYGAPNAEVNAAARRRQEQRASSNAPAAPAAAPAATTTTTTTSTSEPKKEK